MTHSCIHKIFVCIFIFHILSLLIIETDAKVPAVIVFGDSSVDAGNNNFIPTIARSNFQPYGRDFLGGKATDVLSVIPLWKELEYYKEYQEKLEAYQGKNKAKETISEALHMMSLGTNDFLENYYTLPNGRSSQYTIQQYEDFLIGIAGNFIKQIYSLGARKISLGGLPPMGCLPLERTTNFMSGSECLPEYNNVSLEFNDKLQKLTVKLNNELPGIKLVFSNPYFIFMDILRKPSNWGYEVASVACCATGLFEMGYACNRNNMFTCTDAAKYVFWDSFHPTEKTNHIIANYVVKHVLTQFLI
ncbi:GDSL esterase/lipase [Quillaja saponaria]|uniref:GDSL esterase/lipase n=1 Tax=Quillaja saponaria TaxID=32244 RepID=A0AAD7LN17_QUISA|nr:GDSL esterase/lipase [Quillaja saponaria]